MDKKQLVINTMYFRKNKKKKSDMLYIVTKDADGIKKERFIKDPKYSYYVDTDMKKFSDEYYKPIEKRDKNVPQVDIKRKYGKVYTDIKSTTKRTIYYKNLIKNIAHDTAMDKLYEHYKKNSPNKLRNFQKNATLHSSDRDLSDFYIAEINKLNKTIPDSENTIISYDLLYFDIENDISDIDVFPNPFIAPAPVCLITYFYKGVIKSLVLNYDIYELQELKNNEEYMQEFKDFIYKKYEKNHLVNDIIIKFFDNEKEMILYFFDDLKLLNPDFVIAWNNEYDVNTLINRITAIDTGRIPHTAELNNNIFMYSQKTLEQILPEEVVKRGLVNGFYRKSDQQLINKRNSYYKLPMPFNFIDSMYIFAANHREQLDAYSLENVAQEIIHKGKDELPPGVTMKNFLFKAFKKFLLYNIQDVLAMVEIDLDTDYINTTATLADMCDSRFEQAKKNSVSVINYFRKVYEENGFIFSNNKNNLDGNENDLDRRFKLIPISGAFTSDPLLIKDDIGEEFIDRIFAMVYDNTCDLDFASQYPWIIITCSIDHETFVGKIILTIDFREDRDYKYGKEKIKGPDGKFTEIPARNPTLVENLKNGLIYEDNGSTIKTDMSPLMIEQYFAKDFIAIGNTFLNLPNVDEMISLVEEKLDKK